MTVLVIQHAILGPAFTSHGLNGFWLRAYVWRTTFWKRVLQTFLKKRLLKRFVETVLSPDRARTGNTEKYRWFVFVCICKFDFEFTLLAQLCQ
jgi:hypothetical protein